MFEISDHASVYARRRDSDCRAWGKGYVLLEDLRFFVPMLYAAGLVEKKDLISLVLIRFFVITFVVPISFSSSSHSL